MEMELLNKMIQDYCGEGTTDTLTLFGEGCLACLYNRVEKEKEGLLKSVNGSSSTHYNSGYDSGYEDGLAENLRIKNQVLFDEGYSEGFSAGQEDGERIGYKKGYFDGIES